MFRCFFNQLLKQIKGNSILTGKISWLYITFQKIKGTFSREKWVKQK
jgi:hypothetical protein